jgi:hypothetical protein
MEGSELGTVSPLAPSRDREEVGGVTAAGVSKLLGGVHVDVGASVAASVAVLVAVGVGVLVAVGVGVHVGVFVAVGVFVVVGGRRVLVGRGVLVGVGVSVGSISLSLPPPSGVDGGGGFSAGGGVGFSAKLPPLTGNNMMTVGVGSNLVWLSEPPTAD